MEGFEIKNIDKQTKEAIHKITRFAKKHPAAAAAVAAGIGGGLLLLAKAGSKSSDQQELAVSPLVDPNSLASPNNAPAGGSSDTSGDSSGMLAGMFNQFQAQQEAAYNQQRAWTLDALDQMNSSIRDQLSQVQAPGSTIAGGMSDYTTPVFSPMQEGQFFSSSMTTDQAMSNIRSVPRIDLSKTFLTSDQQVLAAGEYAALEMDAMKKGVVNSKTNNESLASSGLVVQYTPDGKVNLQDRSKWLSEQQPAVQKALSEPPKITPESYAKAAATPGSFGKGMYSDDKLRTQDAIKAYSPGSPTADPKKLAAAQAYAKKKGY